MTQTQKLTEAQLIDALQQRQQAGFAYLYDNYSGAIFTIISSIVTDKELAADVLQEVFVKIWRSFDKYDASKAKLYTWMLNIARNTAIDTVRSKAFNNSQQNRELTEFVYENAGSVETNTDKIGLRKVVHTLKDEYKVLVELSYFQGFTQDEIAKMLDIPLGTVKTRLRAALIQLRTMIKP